MFLHDPPFFVDLAINVGDARGEIERATASVGTYRMEDLVTVREIAVRLDDEIARPKRDRTGQQRLPSFSIRVGTDVLARRSDVEYEEAAVVDVRGHDAVEIARVRGLLERVLERFDLRELVVLCVRERRKAERAADHNGTSNDTILRHASTRSSS